MAAEWDSDAFWKGQDFQTSTRLHMQHWIWQYQLGYNRHPDIKFPAEQFLRIADVACGNGAWLLDMHREEPQHIYHGFDLTTANFPAAAWLPSNMHLQQWDAFSSVAEELIESFDVVHIRTMYSSVIANNVQPLLSNLLRMLKPGGYLQWDESDFPTLSARTPSKDTNAPASETLVKLQLFFAQAQNKLYVDWLHELPATLHAQGCQVVAHDLFPPRPELARAWADNMLTVLAGVAPMLPEQAIPLPPGLGLPASVSRRSFADLVMQSAEESRTGVCICHDHVVIVARKAL